jgi:hypothetical protein
VKISRNEIKRQAVVNHIIELNVQAEFGEEDCPGAKIRGLRLGLGGKDSGFKVQKFYL